jgi:hypothetical protein
MMGEDIVGRHHVAQVVLAGDGVVLRLGLGVAAQIEDHAHTAECGDGAGLGEVVVLVAAPAMDEEHARRGTFHRRRRDQHALDALASDRDIDRLIAQFHEAPRACTW